MNVVEVPVGEWLAGVRSVLADDFGYLDWLSAVDTGAGLEVIAHFVRIEPRARVLLRTELGADDTIDSITPLVAGADWHERESAEMFGITFTGHPDPRPLLLPPAMAGHPLRKSFPLPARVQQPWPGEHEPGADVAPDRVRSRRRTTPPGTPDEWREG